MTTASIPARSIPPLAPAESIELERAQLGAFVSLLESLPLEAWRLPTARSSWEVQTLVAHIAGKYAAQASFAELRRQTTPRLVRFYRMEGESLADTVARIQIGDRRHRSPGQLIAELREEGRSAIERRTMLFRPLRVVGWVAATNLRLPAVPLGPFRSVRELWFHRFDISDAAGIAFALETERDGPIIAELVRNLAGAGDAVVGERAVELIVRGPAGGRWRFGAGDNPEATIELEPRVFALLLSGRRSPAGVRERSIVAGDVRLAMSLLSAIHPTIRWR